MINFKSWKAPIIERSKQGVLLLIALCFLSQVGTYIAFISQSASPRKIVATKDDDAAVAVATAVKTKWYNDNTWRAYGPVYYRIAHTMARIFPFTFKRPGESKQDIIEKSHHFVLMLISLISVYLMAFLLAQLLTKNIFDRILLSMALAGPILASEMFSRFVLRAHPDMLFSFFTLWALVIMYQAFQSPNEPKYFRYSAILWGIAASTKLSVLLMVPAVLVALIFPMNKSQRKERSLFVSKYFGWAAFGYFLIGFPQNFIIHKTIRFLLATGKHSQPTTWGSIQGHLTHLVEQSWAGMIALLVILVFISISTWKAKTPRPTNSSFLPQIKIIFIILFSLLTLLLKNMSLPMGHYTLPYIGPLLLIVIVLFKTWRPVSESLTPVLRIGLIALLGLSHSTTTQSMNKELLNQLKCHTEAYRVLKLANHFWGNRQQILADPYTPVDPKDSRQYIHYSWEHHLGHIRQHTKALFMNENYYGRYTDRKTPTHYVKTSIPRWVHVQRYYKLFHKKNQARGPLGRMWKKIYHDKCGFIVWQRQ